MRTAPGHRKRAQFNEIMIIQIRDGTILGQRGIVDGCQR